MRIDSHVHFWDYARNATDYGWMTSDVLRRDRGPEDLAPLLVSRGFDGCVAVQAREVEAETGYLLALAAEHPLIHAVVGWLDLCDPGVGLALERHAASRKLRGLRMLIHDRADPGFAASEPHRRGVALLGRFGLAYDLLLRPAHLPAAIELVDSLPDQSFVIDHLAKPDLTLARDEAWLAGLPEIAKRPNVFCKLSGMITEADPQEWRTAPYAPYLDRTLELFGANRLMIGSDWPVCASVAPYEDALDVIERWASPLSVDERAAIMGGTARVFYGIGS